MYEDNVLLNLSMGLLIPFFADVRLGIHDDPSRKKTKQNCRRTYFAIEKENPRLAASDSIALKSLRRTSDEGRTLSLEGYSLFAHYADGICERRRIRISFTE